MESDEMTCDEMKIETADVKKTGTLDRPAQILKKNKTIREKQKRNKLTESQKQK